MNTDRDTQKEDWELTASIEDTVNVLKHFGVTILGTGWVNMIVCLSEKEQLSLGTPKILTSFRVDVTYVTENDVAKMHNDRLFRSRIRHCIESRGGEFRRKHPPQPPKEPSHKDEGRPGAV